MAIRSTRLATPSRSTESETVWRLPYTAQQLQDAATNQVPRISAENKHWERWNISTNAWDDTDVIAQGNVPVRGYVQTSVSWTDNDPVWSQVVTISNVTKDSEIYLRPSPAQLAQLADDGVNALQVENNNGTVTVYAIGAEPTTAMTIAYTMYDSVDTGGMDAVGMAVASRMAIPRGMVEATDIIFADEYTPVYGTLLWDGTTGTTGSYIDNNGSVVSSSTSITSPFMSVTNGAAYIWVGTSQTSSSSNHRVHGFNASGNWVEMITSQAPAAGAAYSISFTISNTNITQIKACCRNGDTNMGLYKR